MTEKIELNSEHREITKLFLETYKLDLAEELASFYHDIDFLAERWLYLVESYLQELDKRKLSKSEEELLYVLENWKGKGTEIYSGELRNFMVPIIEEVNYENDLFTGEEQYSINLKLQATELRNTIERNKEKIDDPTIVTGILSELDFFIKKIGE